MVNYEKKFKDIISCYLFVFFCNVVNAVSKKNLVNIYLFHSYTCKHCKEEIKLLDELEKNMIILRYINMK